MPKNIQEKYNEGDHNFVGINLIDANLSGADLTGADLSNANLSGAKGLVSPEKEIRIDRFYSLRKNSPATTIM